jgi:hypothetical protein
VLECEQHAADLTGCDTGVMPALRPHWPLDTGTRHDPLDIAPLAVEGLPDMDVLSDARTQEGRPGYIGRVPTPPKPPPRDRLWPGEISPVIAVFLLGFGIPAIRANPVVP